MTTENFRTLHSFDTTYNADTIEWCPISPFRNSFACGTYHLIEGGGGPEVKEYSRKGGVIIFSVTKNGLEENWKVDCPAVLDMKWCWRKLNNKIILAVANAIGEIAVFQFEFDKKLSLLAKRSLKNESDGDYLSLSLDWTKQNGGDSMCISDSKGNITVLGFSDDDLIVLKEWNAHSLEAWIVCFDSFQENIIYSGGDDGELKVWDCRGEFPAKVASTKKHTAGVTVVNSNVYTEYKLVSGSYDETVLLWDTRNWKNPLKSIAASGGLWRLKWEPKKGSAYLLGACIYGGFQVYDTSTAVSVGDYKDHDSLAYGADWCHLNDGEIDDLLGCGPSFALIATCSFYDHNLRVSLWKHEGTSMS